MIEIHKKCRQFISFLFPCLLATPSLAYEAPKTLIAPVIDGSMNDPAWQQAEWHRLAHFILGEATDEADFSGRFKIVWTPERLYVLAQINDDVLLDNTANPLVKYWEDDIFEVLLDEDASGGDHHSSYNAFAYHISLDNQVVDIAEDGKPRLLNDHVESKWQRSNEHDKALIWEASIKVFDDSFTDSNNKASPVTLSANKVMGFMVAYCDADDPARGRDAFITSHDIAPANGDKNRAYLDASVFGKLVLTGE